MRDAQRTVMELGCLGRGQVHLVVNRCRKKLLKSLHQTIDDAIDSAGLPHAGMSALQMQTKTEKDLKEIASATELPPNF